METYIPGAECGGGEEEGPVAPVVAGRDGRAEDMVAKARGGRGEGDAALVVTVDEATRSVRARRHKEPAGAGPAAVVRRRG